MKITLAVFLISLAGFLFGQEKPVPLGTVQDGVYFLDGWAQTTILELKGGQFRYWFRSDLKYGKEPAYPLSGSYTNEGGGRISFEHKTGTSGVTVNGQRFERDFFQTERWEFMRYKGQVTLWTSNSLASWKEKSPHPVLYQTDRKPEDIWGRKR